MCSMIIDLITGEQICCKHALKTAKERVQRHNSTYAYAHRGVHLPENAYLVVEGDTIYIKKLGGK